MRTLFYIFSCLCLVSFATWSYNVNYATREAAARVALLEAKLGAEADKIDILRAEWEYLNRPERLLRLAEANFDVLGLVPARPDHFGEVAQVPYPHENVDDMILHAIMTSAQEDAEQN